MSQWLLALVLWLLGHWLRWNAALRPRLRAQITHPVRINVCSDDGIARVYVFANRRINAQGQRDASAQATLAFASAGLALQCLLSTQLFRHVTEGLHNDRIRIEGDGLLVLWFQGMINQALPLVAVPRYASRLPNAYVKASDEIIAADRITREPVSDTLDPNWTGAAQAREKIIMLQAAKGKPIPPF